MPADLRRTAWTLGLLTVNRAVAKGRGVREEPDSSRSQETWSFCDATRLPPSQSLQNANEQRGSKPYPSPSQHTNQQYDFIVVGGGSAGRAALQELHRQCPSASIAVVDPQLPTRNNGTRDHWPTVQGYARAAASLDPRRRTLQLAPETPSGNPKPDSQHVRANTILSYRHAVLLATGAYGAPVPHYIHDASAQARILQWKGRPLSTTRPNFTCPEQIQQHLVQSASQGQTIAILGSGWAAVALALQTATVSRRRRRPLLIMGAPGPLSYVLPNYLVAAVTKRLQSKHYHISIKNRTLLRYVSDTATHQTLPQHSLQLYSAKTFDYLDSQVDAADWVVVAPDVTGPRGSAALGGAERVPGHLVDSSQGRRWYQSWSDMTLSSYNDPMSVACYQEDGRVAVNAELCACTGVYAAGSLAKYPNSFTGHAGIAGEGPDEAADAGRVAAHNMASLYLQVNESTRRIMPPAPRSKDPIPVFRTDSVLRDHGTGRSVLADHGINALLVGQCDAERFYTIGVWWTNQAAQRRLLAELETRQPSAILRRRSTVAETSRPIYGVGIVYYFDRTGKIQGVMSWGLPYVWQDENGSHLNESMVQEMKHIIQTNGGFRAVTSDADHALMTKYLTESGRRLAMRSLTNQTGELDTSDDAIDSLPRPLIRYTQNRRNSIRTGVLKRKEGQSFGVLGEDLFARYQGAVEESHISRPDMSVNVGYAAQQAQDLYDWNVWEQKEAQWEENESLARPPREDPLWIRKGDEIRQTSSKDMVLAAYNKALWGHSS